MCFFILSLEILFPSFHFKEMVPIFQTGFLQTINNVFFNPLIFGCVDYSQFDCFSSLCSQLLIIKLGFIDFLSSHLAAFIPLLRQSIAPSNLFSVLLVLFFSFWIFFRLFEPGKYFSFNCSRPLLDTVLFQQTILDHLKTALLRLLYYSIYLYFPSILKILLHFKIKGHLMRYYQNIIQS